MPANAYHFTTTWLVPAGADEISAILADAEALPRWWPSVYLDVRVLDPGAADGVGRIVDLWTRGRLPYTLRWRFRVVAADPPRGFTIEAFGDFVGHGVWTLVENRPAGDADGPLTTVTYDWRITAEKPLLKRLSWLMRPAFAANHRWAMARGEESLRLEILRRHGAADPVARSLVPEAPGAPRRRERRSGA